MSRRGAALHALVGAYVIDAVPAADRAAFERHLARCESCRDEVRGLREAAARLGMAAAVRPRPELRDQTLRAATRLRQAPPLIGAERVGEAGGPAAGVARRRAWLRAGGPMRASRLRLVAVAAVAVAILFAGVAAGLGLHASSMQHRLSAAEQRDRAIASVLGATDAVRLTAKVSTGGMATVVMSHRARALVFIGRQLSVLPVSKAYELWIMGPSGDKPAGMLPPAHDGMSGPVVVSGLVPGDQMLGLTIEPASGSRQPTSNPIVLVGLGG
ncbi:MAG TPA: anti-sigma factor [Streptosporangiaceae bacterium]|nr:anti-sigma factor [Streptosporangiaceae bacterium]